MEEEEEEEVEEEREGKCVTAVMVQQWVSSITQVVRGVRGGRLETGPAHLIN